MAQTTASTVPRMRHYTQHQIIGHTRHRWCGLDCMLSLFSIPKGLLLTQSNSITKYNLVLGVLSTFFLITKLPVHWMHLFYPPVAVGVHASLIILYIVSAVYQAGSDLSDPNHLQSGAPWYIAKSCSVAYRKSNVAYCMQAKSLFAITVILMFVTLFHDYRP
jgi:hypothetical protein